MKTKYSDHEVWDKYTQAQEELDKWEDEFRKRGLHNKPFVQWSHVLTELVAEE